MSGNQVSHILRQRSREFKLLSGHRVGKAQIDGMKRLTVDQTVVRAVEKIPRQRVPDGFHMDADLVRSSGFQQETDEREVGVLVVCNSLIMGHSSITPLRIADALNGRAVFSGDRKVNGAGVSCLSGNDGGVFPVDRMILHGI